MNNDLISRKALLEFAHNHVGHTIDCNDIARFPAVPATPKWISVKDRLPDTGDWVVCWYRDQDGCYFPTCGIYHYGRWDTDVDGNDCASPVDVITHWMPLPAPPQ